MLKKLFIGLISGFISGFFGAGGGLVLVPALVHILHLSEKESRATAVFAILPMVITSMFFYYKYNYINWNIGIKCAFGGVLRRIYWFKNVKNSKR